MPIGDPEHPSLPSTSASETSLNLQSPPLNTEDEAFGRWSIDDMQHLDSNSLQASKTDAPKSKGKATPSDEQPTATAMLQKSLQFVNMTDTAVLDASARKIVRAHVMKDYDKRLTAARKSSIISNAPVSASRRRKRAHEGMHRWRPGPSAVSNETEARDKGKGPQSPAASTSSTERTSQSWGSSDHALEDLDETLVESDLDIVGSTRGVERTSKEPSNQSKTWDPGNIEPMELLSSDQAQLEVSRGRQFGVEFSLEQFLSPPVYNLGVARGHFDPFQTLPFTSPRSEVLVTHFHSRIMCSSLMMSARKHWFILATSDRALFLVALSHSAGNLSLQQQKRTWDAPEALQLRTEAIRVINERILNAGKSGPTDGTIGAVASMLSYEATNGTPDSIRTHINGLAQMIAIRGGIIFAGFNPALLRLILWADLNTANVLATKPMYPPLSAYDPSNSPANPLPHILMQDLNSQWGNTAPLMLLPQPLTFSLLELRHLVQILNLPRNIGAAAALRSLDSLYFSDRVYNIQRTLMDLATEYTSPKFYLYTDQPPEIIAVAAPIAIAGLIFVECILREISPSARIIGTLLVRLVAAISQAQFIKIYDEGTGELIKPFQAKGLLQISLWAIAVGGTVASDVGNDPGQRGWWAAELSELARGSEIGNVDLVLKSVVWPDEEGSSTRWTKRWTAMWHDVIKLQEDEKEEISN